MLQAAVACVLLFLTAIHAECPNGCSGRGSCTSKDMCVCYKNFQGNDCSERTCGFGYAHTDTPKGDLNMDSDTADNNLITPVYVGGTDEYYYNGAVAEEGHFYMECSNQGLCDRETGDCVCFDGFEGSACQRASCPNSCSGHGSCESISEFASTAGGSLFTKGLTTGDTSYDLWDAKVGYGCRCDPWFTGADCSLRTCKVGVDPMYYDTEQVTYETILISFESGQPDDWIRIKFWDYWGESYITDRIGINSDAASKIETALEALPNGVISNDLECKDLTTDSPHADFFPVTITFGGSKVLCQFKSNPGALRLPVIESSSSTTSDTSITGTPLRGEDESLCTQLATDTITDIVKTDGTPDEYTVKLSGKTTSLPATPFLAKILDQYVVVSGATLDGTPPDDQKHVLTLVTGLEAASSISYDLYFSSTTLGGGKVMATGGAVGGTKIVMGDGAHGFAAKDKIICENQIYTVKAVATTDITIDRPFFGVALTNGDNPETNCHEIPTATATTTYVAECSARGICDRESGVCTCFKGYTNDNCDKQSILAF